MFKRKGGVKGLLNNVKKNALFLMDGFPKSKGIVTKKEICFQFTPQEGFQRLKQFCVFDFSSYKNYNLE